MIEKKFIIQEMEGVEVVGFASSPYLNTSKDRSKAKEFAGALEASAAAFALKEKNHKTYLVKMIED